MEILENLNKNNLHHAYLIEGAREEIIPKIFKFMEDLGIKTSGNPDFCHISLDSFKIEDAHNLKSVEYEKSFSTTFCVAIPAWSVPGSQRVLYPSILFFLIIMS